MGLQLGITPSRSEVHSRSLWGYENMHRGQGMHVSLIHLYSYSHADGPVTVETKSFLSGCQVYPRSWFSCMSPWSQKPVTSCSSPAIQRGLREAPPSLRPLLLLPTHSFTHSLLRSFSQAHQVSPLSNSFSRVTVWDLLSPTLLLIQISRPHCLRVTTELQRAQDPIVSVPYPASAMWGVPLNPHTF